MGIVACVVCYLAAYTAVTIVPSLARTGSRFGQWLTGPFKTHVDAEDQASRWRHLNLELDRDLGRSDRWGREARADLVQAAAGAQRITLLDTKMRQGIRRCLDTHWAVAQGLGATSMHEAARYPVCQQHRQRTIDLSEMLAAQLEVYPLLAESPELTRLHVGVQWIAPMCTACPYWSTSVADAPRICPTATAIGHRTGPAQSPGRGIVDGEVCEP